MDITCLLAALLFFLGNLLKLIHLGREWSDKVHHDVWKGIQEMDTNYIRIEWDKRASDKAFLISCQVIVMSAWFVFTIPMLQLAYALNKQKGPGTSRSVWLHTAMVVLTLGGAFTEWIGNFMLLGATLAMEMMVKRFELTTWLEGQVNDELGWRTLEVVYFAFRGMTFWVDAFEWLCLFFLFIFTFVAVRRYRQIDPVPFGNCWNCVGLFVGLMCLLDFITEVLRVVDYRIFSQLALWYGTVNRLILLPFWLLVLGMRLPVALRKIEEAEATASSKKDDDLVDLALAESGTGEPPVVVTGEAV